MADKNGNTVVYNDKDVPIGTGSVRKVSERSYEVGQGGDEREMASNLCRILLGRNQQKFIRRPIERCAPRAML